MTETGPREQLLGRAIACYAEHGVRDTSLRTLAARIGTSQRMLHYHFGSREDLLTAMIQHIAAAEAAALEESWGEDPFDALQRHWERARTAAATFGPLFFELCAHAMYGKPYAQDLADVLVTKYGAAFARIYGAMTDPAHAQRLARLSLGVGRGVLCDMLLDGDQAAADAAVEEFTQLVRQRLGQDTA